MYMFPQGSKTSTYALVFYCPEPLQAGIPFSGVEGTIVKSLLQTAGINPTDCYITYLYKEIDKPTVPVDKIEIHEIEQLRTELSNTTCKVIVPFGAHALHALTGEDKISAYRGSILYNQCLPGRKIIPTYSPGTVIHGDYLYQYYIMYDLLKIKAEGQSEEGPPQRDLIIQPSYDTIMQYLEQCEAASMVAFDIECLRTSKEGKFVDWEVSCLSFALSSNSAICIPFIHSNQDYMTLEQEIEVWKKINKILSDPEIAILGQNITFDASFLRRKMRIYINNLQDTMVAAGLLFPDFPKGLDFLCSVHSREPYYKGDGKLSIKANNINNSFWIYNAKDSAVLWDIYPKLVEYLKKQGNLETYNSVVRVIPALLDMMDRGILADKDRMDKASEALNRAEKDLLLQLYKAAGREINPNSPKQLQEFFYEERGYKPIKKRKKPNKEETGSPYTTDEQALKKLSLRGSIEARLVLDIRKLVKLRGTYMDMTLDKDNRLRTSFNPVGTVTGRLSSSKTIFGTGGNQQNLPTEFKQCLLADPGYTMYEVDLSQAENRIVAYIAPEIKMIEAFETGVDVHSLTASFICGKTVEEIKAEHKNKVPAPIGAGDKTWRHWGKQANHSLNYGLGVGEFANRLEIPTEDANFIRNRYLSAYPGVLQYHNWTMEQVRKTRTITNCFGRRRKFFNKLQFIATEVYSQIPQSTVADIINRWGLTPMIEDSIYSDCILLNQVHDSIYFQIETSLGWEYHAKLILLLQKSLTRPIYWHNREFRIPIGLSIGSNMGDRKEVPIELDTTVDQLTASLTSIGSSL